MDFADVSEAVEYLLKNVSLNPLDIIDFSAVWRTCQARGFPLLPLWKIKTHFLALSPKDIQEWETCIVSEVSDPSTQTKELEFMTQLLCQKYPTPHNFLRRFNVGGVDDEFVLQAYELCGRDYLFGQLIWEKVTSLSYFEKDTEALTKLYLSRLLIPHRQLQDTFLNFSSWISSQNSNSYTSFMKEASAIVKETEKKIRYYEQYESLISEKSDNSLIWTDYIEKIAKYTPKDASFHQITQLFLRSLTSGSCKIASPEWIPVWTAYLINSEDRENSHRFLWCLEFIKTYPHHCQSYNMVARGLSIPTEIDTLLTLIEKSECIKPENYSDWKELAMNVIILKFKAFTLENERINDFLQTVEFLAFAAAEFSDKYHEVVKLCVSILESLNEERATKLAAKIVSEVFEAYALQASVWLYSLEFFYRNGRTKHVNKLLTLWQEDAFEVDRLEFFLNEIVMFYRLHYEFSEYLQAFDKANEIRKIVIQKPAEKFEEVGELKTKRQRTDNSKQSEPVRSREQFRIKIADIPSWITESEISTFFEGYGIPLSIQIGRTNNPYAIVEFSSEAEVLASLARDKKLIHGKEVSVSRIFANTVWVTNYPPAFDPSDVEKMIDDTGFGPLSIRFPVQNDNKQRRFCYVDFGSEEEAQAVRNSLHEKDVNGFIIHAEISNPSLKRARHTQPVTRQVYVHNLNFKSTTEDSLWQFFSKFGDLESIKMPLNAKNMSLGNQNNGFAFITFTTETGAKEAISLGTAELDGRRVAISIVKPKEAVRKSTRFEGDLTVSIHNVNEIVTEDCLKVHIEAKVGPVAKCQLMPSKKGALVQFLLVANAGRASIVLEGTEFEDRILHVGQMLDFTLGEKEHGYKNKDRKEVDKAVQETKPEAETRTTPRMVPPMLLRRRKR